MKFLNGCYGRKRINKNTISSPVDLFYNDPVRYINLMPGRLERELVAIDRLNPKIAEIKSLVQLKAFLNIFNISWVSDDIDVPEYDLKFIVTKQRTLLLGECLRVGSYYVTHAAIFNVLGYNNSEEIIAAGKIVAASDFRGIFKIFATNESGHFKPGDESVRHLDALIKRWGGYGAYDD
ncbi:hypothetical protein F3J29_19285 [Enterobacter sp. Cy-643]|uniref:hypothetical protein n=1 Tax=Enterobacter sp. Cy-643 TaxID=2608346 RepID=UPI0014232727|nr:hypothetical protein [Enterobacter sp. Cy-643]NIF34271.1 hypothetical protein [Enterobacter sp. Cy-643]